MKKFLIVSIVLLATIATSCRSTGTYTTVTGVEGAKICFTSDKTYSIDVNIDGNLYKTNTVKDNEYKAKRNIRNTVREAISVSPGKHDIVVTKNSQQLYKKKIFISTDETKIIKL